MAELAKKAGLGRESLYQALAPGAHPRYDPHGESPSRRRQRRIRPRLRDVARSFDRHTNLRSRFR